MSLEDWAKKAREQYEELEAKADAKVSWLEARPYTAALLSAAAVIAVVVGLFLLVT